MAQAVIQSAFHSGEWAPALNARVDLAKYRSAAALLRNFFVDYRGGASTRPGTRYILHAKGTGNVRLIPFQASFTVNYAMEFGEQYIRFYRNGAPVLETGLAISAATQANPLVITVVGHNYAVGDWIYITGVLGMTQLNGRYFKISVVAGNNLTLQDLWNANVNSTGYGAYTSGGTTQRVFTLVSPYAAADVFSLKYAQNVNTLVICHPSYVPYVLTFTSATSWTLVPIVFGTNIAAPGSPAAITSSAGAVNFSYVVTAVDLNGQESVASAVASSTANISGATITFSWAAVSGAQSYNVYRAPPSTAGVVPVGSMFGFVTNVTGTSFDDLSLNGQSVNPADYAQTIPVPKNPFQGAGVASVTITNQGTGYTTTPTVTFGTAPAGGTTATGISIMEADAVTSVAAGGSGYIVGDTITYTGGVVVTVATILGGGVVTGVTLTQRGNIQGTVPINPVSQIGTSGSGTGCTLNFNWRVKGVAIISAGSGYVSAPSVTFSAGAAAGTAVLEASTAGNPSVPSYAYQRLWLAAPNSAPSQFNISQPASYYNFNISNPIQADDAIEGTIVANQLNVIKSLTPMPSGVVALCDRQAFLINGGQAGAPPTPIDIAANSQAYNGASDLPPIVANFDLLYVQAKGSIVRDLAYNFYTNVYAGVDISILSSHLFYGYTLIDWAYAEEPFKIIWAVRSDGTLLSLTFMKEQELVGWAHSDTDGLFKSVCSITEQVSFGSVDGVYVVVERTINSQTIKYIERLAERFFENGAEDAWCVDAGLQYDGAPATTFTGGEHLAGETVTGLRDGTVITPFVMPANGSFTLASSSKVTIGLAFTAQLQTLALDLGEPTVQGKRKKIPAVTVRCQETLGLKIGCFSSTLVPMKDLVVGNVSSALQGQPSQTVTGLVTGDARTIVDPSWTIPGQYFIEQSDPLPATILGVIPEITVGDR